MVVSGTRFVPKSVTMALILRLTMGFQACANLVNKRHRDCNVLDHVTGVVFLGTPYVEDPAQLDLNIVGSIVRSSATPLSFFSFRKEENQAIAQMVRGLSPQLAFSTALPTPGLQ